jgi:hypothetical protein
MPVGEYNFVKVVPNPVNKQLSVVMQLPDQVNADLVLTNMLGQVVYQKRIDDNVKAEPTFKLNTEGYAAGIYHLSILTNKYIVSKIIMIAH